MIEQIKYIDDNIQYGIEYDFKLIKKEFNKLNIPKNVYNPWKYHEIRSGEYYMDVSERSIGKTTQWLLIGMIMNKIYGTRIQYVRQIEDMLMPRNMDLFNVIIANGYVSKITDGKYDSIRYGHRRFYYYNTETSERADNHFCMALAISLSDDYKSSYNDMYGDIIIFDEFVSRMSTSDEFVHFHDLTKTIIRERDSPFIILSGNTIDRHNIYFREFEVYDDIQHMKINSHRRIETAGGSIVNVNLIGTKIEDMPKHRREHNKKFYAFKNPKLNSIRGGEWAQHLYPHMPSLEKKPKVLANNIYLRHNGYLCKLDIFNDTEQIGLGVLVKPAERLHDDSIVFCLDNCVNKNERYGYGYTKMDKLVWDLFDKRKWYYATNYEGTLIDSYINEIE